MLHVKTEPFLLSTIANKLMVLAGHNAATFRHVIKQNVHCM